MKDIFCNDSTSSFGTLNNDVETIEIAIDIGTANSSATSEVSIKTTSNPTSIINKAKSISSTEQSTSNTNLSTITTSIDINDEIDDQKLKKKAKFIIECSDEEESYPTSGDEEFNKTSPKKSIKKTGVTSFESFEEDFDKEVENIIEKATETIENENSWFKCGFYQFISFIFISIAWSIGNGWYAYVSVFVGYSPPMRCDLNYFTNLSYNNNETIYTVSEDQCSFINNSTSAAYQCEKWIYDKSQLKSTIITEYDFVCENNYKFETGFSLEQIGYVIGTLIFSITADKHGRKPVFVGVLGAMTFFGITQFFIENFYLYMLIGFVINIFASGLDSVSVPLVLEMVNTNRRTGFGMGMEYVWVIVLTLLAVVAYIINTWRYLRLFVFIVLGVITLLSYWFVQESVTWLISTNKLNKAQKIIERIARFNQLTNSTKYKKHKNNLDEKFRLLSIYNDAKEKENRHYSLKESTAKLDIDGKQIETEVVSKKKNKDALMDIIKNSKYRLYVIIMSLNWFVSALIYDGLTYLNSYVGENIFINWTLMNIVELPAQIICYFSLSRLGRRLTTSIFLIVGGSTLIFTAILSSIYDDLNWIKLVLFVIAKFSATQAYSAVILHAPEIFPTHLRSFGYGICLFSGKITAIFSPLISLYLIKIVPWLPSIIYGFISVICGFTCLYVPETLNRPLPNSIEDVLKWGRNLSPEEWEKAREANQINFIKKLKKFFCKKRKASVSIVSPQSTNTQNTIIFLNKNNLDIG